MADAFNSPKFTTRTILLSWLLVGTLDISCAIISFLIKGGTNPSLIFIYISSALYGPEQVQEMNPTSMEILGLCLHYLIALIWTVIFFSLYRRIPSMHKNRFITGIVYGFFMQIIMSQIVVKLSNAATGPFKFVSFLISGAILVIAIGIPLSFIAYRNVIKNN
ncbi:MAG: hypothetical protein WDO15_27610 [Bacteroidota bacterium]